MVLGPQKPWTFSLQIVWAHTVFMKTVPHFALYTLHSALYTLHSALCTASCAGVLCTASPMHSVTCCVSGWVVCLFQCSVAFLSVHGPWEVWGGLLQMCQCQALVLINAYCSLWLNQTCSLLKEWGLFVHLDRGHSAVMFTSRAKSKNSTTIWLQSFRFLFA